MSESLQRQQRPKPRPLAGPHWEGPMADVFPARPASDWSTALQQEPGVQEALAAPAEPISEPAPEASAPALAPRYEQSEPTGKILGRLERALSDSTPAAPAETILVAEPEPEAEDADAKLERELNAVEGTDVPETPFEPGLVDEAPAAPETPEPAPKAIEPEPIPEPVFAEKPERAPAHRKRNVAPHHHELHAPSPSEGLRRVGRHSYQHAAGTPQAGKFASKEEYEKQLGVNDPNAATKHYDEVMGLNEAQPETPERPNYESMNVNELAFAAAKAELIGDKFVTDEIRAAYATPIEEEYTKPDGTMSYEEYEAAIARFDHLVEIATEFEKAKDPEHYALVDAAVERANKEPSPLDKLKSWWGKHKEPVTNLFRPSHWAERWTNAIKPKIGEKVTSILNVGINFEEDSPEEIERKQKRNRVFLTAGGIAVAVAAIALPSFGLGLAVGSGGGHHAAEALTGGGHLGSGTGTHEAVSPHEQAILDSMHPTGNHGGEAVGSGVGVGVGVGAGISEQVDQHQQIVQHAAENASHAAAYNISDGEGGLQLFSSQNLEPAKWFANQENLLKNFPQDFYRMSGGGVGISHQGPLSQAAQDYINGLRG